MLFSAVSVIYKELTRAKVFSEISTNLSKEKLNIIKLNKLNIYLLNLKNFGTVFPKKLFPVQK